MFRPLAKVLGEQFARPRNSKGWDPLSAYRRDQVGTPLRDVWSGGELPSENSDAGWETNPREVADLMQVLEKSEKSLLHQIRRIRFAPRKTKSNLVKRSVKTVDNWGQVRTSDEMALRLVSCLFARNHFVSGYSF